MTEIFRTFPQTYKIPGQNPVQAVNASFQFSSNLSGSTIPPVHTLQF
jgi:hypothetical protein